MSRNSLKWRFKSAIRILTSKSVSEEVHSARNQGKLGQSHGNLALSLDASMQRLKAKDIIVNTVIDVGASDGRWSEKVMNYYPDARYLLIEAQQTHVEGLQSFIKTHRNAEFVMAAAGDRPGESFFDATDPFGGLASHEPIKGENKIVVRVPMTTIDFEVSSRKLPSPHFLKLDTHGFEVPILQGAEKTIAEASVVLIEAYNFRLNGNALRFHEMINYMEDKGFRVVDIIDPLFRRKDQALWQMDLLFIRSDHPVFSVGGYW